MVTWKQVDYEDACKKNAQKLLLLEQKTCLLSQNNLSI